MTDSKMTTKGRIPPLPLVALLFFVAFAALACGSLPASARSDASEPSVQSASPAETSADGQITTTEQTPVDPATSTTDANPGAADDSGDYSATNTAGDAGDYSATDTSYNSATTSIEITTMTTGSGQNKITYYVGDIELAEDTGLQTAFSNGTFGGKVQDTSTVAEANDAILAINGDYYSARDDGIIIRNGVIYRDVPARIGLAIYTDGTMKVYDETTTTADQLLAEGVWNTFSFGPGLLVDGELVDGLSAYEAESNPKHPIQGTNPRTGVGMISANHFVFVVVDGRSPGYSRGMTLDEFAQVFKDLGCTTAYNLDGGGSSTLYFMGNVVNDPSQRNGERSVSDILFVG